MRDGEHHPDCEEWMRDWRQRAHDAEAEVERLQEERDTEAGIRIRAVEQMARYREALKRYGRHDLNCERVLFRSSLDDRPPCLCGYQSALDGEERQ